MNDNDHSVFCGYLTKREIVIRLSQYGIMTEENLKPIIHLRDTQFLSLDTEEFYKKLFNKLKEETEEENECSFTSLDSLDLNDTLAEMEAFISRGIEYSLSELSTPKNDSTFYPKISSTVMNETPTKLNTSYLSDQQNSENSVDPICTLRIISNIDKDNTTEKQSSVKKTQACSDINKIPHSPNNLKENRPNSATMFKTPLPKLKVPNFKNIVSPISRYISETPTVPLLQKVNPKTIPTSEHNFKKRVSSSKTFATLPEVNYKPSKKQHITFEERASPLPKCIEKYISKPLRFEIIKHIGRKNVENKFEEYFETIPFSAQIEDFSEFIDLETTRIGEISVMVSSEAKFSSELRK